MADYHFFATVSRMKYIERWALMRSTRPENLSEHSLETAMIANVLCVIGNVRYGKHLDAEKAAVIGLYHDASEIITGDMPTPVKYNNPEIRSAYAKVEEVAEDTLLRQLPEDLRSYYEGIMKPADDENELYMRRLVKAADKISALIKCIEEDSAGNTEFSRAAASTMKTLEEYSGQYPEVRDFLQEFIESYGKTLDELLSR